MHTDATLRKMSIAESILARICVGVFVVSMLAMMPGCSTGSVDRTTSVDVNATVSRDAIDINVADAAELERLPEIGPRIARRIVEHRAAYGRFRRPEHLMLIDGISETRFRSIHHLVRTD